LDDQSVGAPQRIHGRITRPTLTTEELHMSKQKGKSFYHQPKQGRQLDGSWKTEKGTHVKNMRQQYIADRLSGKLHGISDATRRADTSRIGQMMDWMQNTRGIQDWHHIGRDGRTDHIELYLEHLLRRASVKGERAAAGHQEGLNDRSLANHMSSIRRFAIREGIPLAEKNAEYGLHRNRSVDEEKPIQFTADWEERRTHYQNKLEGVSEATGACGQLGEAFGLRAKERSLSNTELRVEQVTTIEGTKTIYMLSVAGRSFVEQTREQLTSRHLYKASFDKRLVRLEPGNYLIVRAAKGGRVRAQEIHNQERRDALDRVIALCRQNEDTRITNGTPPTVFPYQSGDITDKGTVSKEFMKRVREELTDTYSNLGGTIKNQLHTNADRHWDTQKLYYTMQDGSDFRTNPEMMAYWEATHDKSIFRFSKDDISEERGHSNGRKVCHYSADPLNRF